MSLSTAAESSISTTTEINFREDYSFLKFILIVEFRSSLVSAFKNTIKFDRFLIQKDFSNSWLM